MKIHKFNIGGFPIRLRNTQTMDGTALITNHDLINRVAESYAVYNVLGRKGTFDEIKNVLLQIAKDDWMSENAIYPDVYSLARQTCWYLKKERNSK